MARPTRIKATSQPAWYHVFARAADYIGEYPLGRRGARRKLLSLIRRYCEAYFCAVSAYEILGNHYHADIRFEEPREVAREELRRRALLIRPDWKKELDCWQEPAWDHFRLRLFNLSELMRNIQGEFAKWFNQRFERRGSFWGERFGSNLLADGDAVMDTMIYVELNAVRAGLVDSPELWEHGSFRLRDMGLGDWLMPLAEALPGMDPETVERDYRARLFYRGAVASKEGDHVIPQHIVDDEVRRGFESHGPT